MLIKGRDNHNTDVQGLWGLLDCQISSKQRLQMVFTTQKGTEPT